jgi:hypothetical protein
LYHQMEIYFLPVPAFRCRVFTTIKSMHEKGSNSYKPLHHDYIMTNLKTKFGLQSYTCTHAYNILLNLFFY